MIKSVALNKIVLIALPSSMVIVACQSPTVKAVTRRPTASLAASPTTDILATSKAQSITNANSRAGASIELLPSRDREASYDVRDFGAKGDGTTNDSTAIQATIDSAASAGGGIVFLPPGTYRVKNLVLKSNIHLKGSGSASCLKLLDNSVNWDQVLLIGGNTPCEKSKVSNISFDGNRAQIGLTDVQMHAIDVRSGAQKIEIESVWFQNTCGDGIRASKDGTALPDYPEDLIIRGCFFQNHGRQDIAVVHAFRTLISGCTGSGALDVEPEAPITDVSITNCTFSRIKVNNKGDVTKLMNCSISGCSVSEHVTVWGARGVSFAANRTARLVLSTVKDVQISGSQIRKLISSPPSPNYNESIVVTGNSFTNLTEDGQPPIPQVLSGAGQAPVEMNRTKDVQFSNNQVRSEDVGIFLGSGNSNLTLVNNQLSFSAPSGTTSTSSTGVKLALLTEDLLLKDNTFSAWATAVASDGSAKSVDRAIIKGNIFRNCTGANKTVNLNKMENSQVEDNYFYGDTGVTIGYTPGNNRVIRNTFKGVTTVPKVSFINAGVNSIGWNQYATEPSAPFSATATTVNIEDRTGIRVISTSTGTLTSNDDTVFINYSGPVRLTLPQSYEAGRELLIKDISGSADQNNVSIIPGGSMALEGATQVISTKYGSMKLRLSRTTWRVY